jgi:hypothetical protein
MRFLHQAYATTFLLLASGPALAETHQCNDPLLSVAASAVEVAELVCRAASGAKALMVSCGLDQTAPIMIEVVDVALHPSFGACMAVYDQRTGCLQVTDIDRLPTLLPAGDARAALPAEVLFSASIAHELAHALLQQTAGETQIAGTEQEFVANAFEMQSLAPEWRDLLLNAKPVKPPGSLSLVHLSIYALDPRAFANNAWLVFNQDVMGCSLIQKISEGKLRFPRR